MSSTANHKKMFNILQAAIADKKLLMAVMFQAMADNPGKIAGAYDKVVASRSKRRMTGDSFPRKLTESGFVYKCKDCREIVDAIGIAGACIKCDPDGFDVPY